MKLIKPSVRYVEQERGIDGIYKAIADAAKICYQTEKTKLSDEEFVQMLIKRGHNRCLEFGTVYLTMDSYDFYSYFNDKIDPVEIRKWGKTCCSADGNEICLTTNYRVIVENNLQDTILPYLSEPTGHFRRYTFDYILSRGAADDYRTHVTLSSIMESSRYCNYGNAKFGSEITFIEPYWKYTNEDIADFENAEKTYLKKIAMGMQPQQAKNFLPLGVKTQLRLCGFYDAWNNFFYRRCSTAAYPECCTLAEETKKIYDKVYVL